jgi:hypothetical protein
VSFHGAPHTYYTMVDWALLRFARLTSQSRYRDAAIRHLEWTLRNQWSSGWFDCCSFSPGDPALTHTLSYTTQGLIESGRLLEDDRFVAAARLGTEPLRDCWDRLGWLPGAYDAEWVPSVQWECLTGTAQTAIVWKLLAQHTGDPGWREAGEQLDQRVWSRQKIGSRRPGVEGGIAGSWPIGGRYEPFSFLNHAAKFHLDSLLLTG